MRYHYCCCYICFTGPGSFGDPSPHEEASPSFAHYSTHGHIFPESHHSHLATSSRPGDTAASSGSNRGSSQTLAMSQHMDPRSHPVHMTADDMGRTLSELDLGQLTPTGDGTAATSRQASQPSMVNAQFLDTRQQRAAVSRQSSRQASFTGGAAGRQGRAGQHRRTSSGEEQTAAAAATSHFKLPAKQLHARHVMQEPPLSTRSSYRMDPWDNEAHSSARSYAPSGVLHLPETMTEALHGAFPPQFMHCVNHAINVCTNHQAVLKALWLCICTCQLCFYHCLQVHVFNKYCGLMCAEMSRGASLQAGDSLAMPVEPLSPTRQVRTCSRLPLTAC